MAAYTFSNSCSIFTRALSNLVAKRPLVVSFEVTHACTADCIHCDKGGPADVDKLMQPDDYRRVMSIIKPPVIQISGGEPLMRKDIYEVVRAIKGDNFMPIAIFVTNASLLTEQKYLKLKESGIDRFSVSLDFPDERHDEFRRHKGLFKHIKELIPHLATKYKPCGIAINTAITQRNFKEIVNLAILAKEWRVPISYSAYSMLRTKDRSLFIEKEEELSLLASKIEDVIEFKKINGVVLNPDKTLRKTVRFFRDGQIPDCMAGERFLVVRPDGMWNACSMFPERQYTNQRDMMDDFTKNNNCGECFVAIRAYSSKPLNELIVDTAKLIF